MQTNQKNSRKGERGNALFFILIGVALFAALSFAVSDMMRGGSATSISDETAKLQATDIIDYARSVRQAVQNVRISNGCEDTQISFEKTPFDGSDAGYVNANAPSDFSCHVFHSNGGGLSSPSLSPEGEIWLFSTHAFFSGVGNSGATAELTAYININNDVLCDEINTKLGLDTDITGASAVVNFIQNSGVKFQGTYISTGAVPGVPNGTYTACLDHSSSTSPSLFYQVLIPR